MASSSVKYEYDPRTGSYYRVSPPIDPVGRIDFQRVPLDRQGYTRQGRYFGTGAPLYEWYDDESGKTFHTRASTRAEAKAHFENVRKNLVEYGGYNPMARRRSHRRYYTNPSRSSSKSSGLSDGAKLAIVVGGLGVVAGIGYLIYQNQSSSSQTAAGGAGGNTTSPSYPTTLGPGGSSTALPAAGTTQSTSGSADQTGTDYEAGPGENAPLVPTAGA